MTESEDDLCHPSLLAQNGRNLTPPPLSLSSPISGAFSLRFGALEGGKNREKEERYRMHPRFPEKKNKSSEEDCTLTSNFCSQALS